MKNIDNIDEVIRKYEESEKIRQSIENQHIANWLKELKYLRRCQSIYERGILLRIQNEKREQLIMVDIQAGSIINEETGGYIIDRIDGDRINGIDYETYNIVIPIDYDALENVSNANLLKEISERMCK